MASARLASPSGPSSAASASGGDAMAMWPGVVEEWWWWLARDLDNDLEPSQEHVLGERAHKVMKFAWNLHEGHCGGIGSIKKLNL